MRKIYLSLILILFTLCTLLTSTYAWISSYQYATISNFEMHVETNCGDILVYKEISDSTYDYIVESNSKKTNMKAITTSTCSKWFTSTDGETFTEADSTVISSSVIQYTCYLKVLNNDSYETFYVASIEADGATSDSINKSLRVGITLGSQYTNIYGVLNGATSSYESRASSITSRATVTLSTSDSTFPQYIGTDKIKCDIYLWFEGQDASCTTDNAKICSSNNIKITINIGVK